MEEDGAWQEMGGGFLFRLRMFGDSSGYCPKSFWMARRAACRVVSRHKAEGAPIAAQWRVPGLMGWLVRINLERVLDDIVRDDADNDDGNDNPNKSFHPGTSID